MNTTDCTVFLLSLKAGGVALNLTEASQVFIMDVRLSGLAAFYSVGLAKLSFLAALVEPECRAAGHGQK